MLIKRVDAYIEHSIIRSFATTSSIAGPSARSAVSSVSITIPCAEFFENAAALGRAPSSHANAKSTLAFR